MYFRNDFFSNACSDKRNASWYSAFVHVYLFSFILGEDSENAEDNAITFLYQVVRGKAARSYGLNVARLADIPQDILKMAACKSLELEEIVAGKR